MKIDFAEKFSSGPGLLIRQIAFFALAVWAGCILAASGQMAGKIVEYHSLPGGLERILSSPALLFSGWLFPNAIFLGINFCRLLIYPDSTGVRTWATIVVCEALFSMAEVTDQIWRHPWALPVAWTTCLILMGMACIGFWFLHQWQINRWAGELAMLQTENAARRAEMEAEDDNTTKIP